MSKQLSPGFRIFIAAALLNAVVITCLCGFESQLGIDLNFDLLNYHYYNVYALFHRRIDFDINAANMQTYINPILNIPAYLSITYLPVVWVRPSLAVLDGVSAPLLFFITFASSKAAASPALRLALATFTTAIAMVGPVFLQIAGTSLVDVLAGLPVLGSLAVAIRVESRSDRDCSARRAFLDQSSSALLMGLAAGLKITNAVYLPGYALAVAVVVALKYRGDVARLTSAALGAAFGGACGVFAGLGWWSWTLYWRFGNPLFPYCNNVFGSKFAAGANFVDLKFLPTSLTELALSPLNIARADQDPDPFNSASDVRYALTFVLLFIAVGAAIARRLTRNRVAVATIERETPMVANEGLVLLSIFFIVGFYCWAAQFGIRRYLAPIEMLAPVLSTLLICRVFAGYARIVNLALFAFLAISVQTLLFQREGTVRHRYFADKREFAKYNNSHTTFIMTNGWAPLSYVIPLFSRDNRFIHLVGDFPMEPSSPFGRIAARDIDDARGPIEMIANIAGIGRDLLLQCGLLPTGECEMHTTVVDIVRICDLERTTASSQPAATPLALDEPVDFRLGARGWIYEMNEDCWSKNEDWGVWALPKGAPWCSLLLFRWDGPSADRLALHATVHAYRPLPSKAPKQIAVRLNDRPIGVWSLDDERTTTLNLPLPPGALRPGANWLRFTDEGAISPSEAGVDPGDHRQLSFGLHRLWFSRPSE